MIVYFDIGSTLITGPTEGPAKLLARRLSLADSVREAIERRLLTTIIENPRRLEEVLTSDFGLQGSAIAVACDEVWHSQLECPRRIDGALELLEMLRHDGLPYGFISNIWFPYAQSFSNLFGALSQTTRRFFSFQLGVAKPDNAIYRSALAFEEARPEGCLMVGDSYENDIAPAAALSMETIWLIHRPEKEKNFIEDVRSGRRPGPSLILDSIDALSPSVLRNLIATK